MGAAAALSDRQRWLEERITGIGESDFPVILGISPLKSPLYLGDEKRGEAKEGQPPTPAIQRGNYKMYIIADIYSKSTRGKFRNVNRKGFPILSPWGHGSTPGKLRTT